MVRLHRFGITFEYPYWVVYRLDGLSNKSIFAHLVKEKIYKTKNRDEAYYFVRGKRQKQNQALGQNPSKKGFIRRFINFARTNTTKQPEQ